MLQLTSIYLSDSIKMESGLKRYMVGISTFLTVPLRIFKLAFLGSKPTSCASYDLK